MEVRRNQPEEGAEQAALGRFLDSARNQKRLPPGEEARLLARSRSGERSATGALIDANQVLVVALSENYDDGRLSLMDRIAEGNVALISACRNYRPGPGVSFRRHCQQKIREAIEHALAEVASSQLPVREDETGHSTLPVGRNASSSG